MFGSALWVCHCGTPGDGAPTLLTTSNPAGVSQEIPEIPALGSVTIGGTCPELRRPLDDSSVRELARAHGLELDRVLARATGEFTSTLRWPAADGKVTALPESGDVPLTIRVSYLGGLATYVDGTDYEGLAGTDVPGCPDRAEVEVSVEVHTEGGALNERFDAVLVMEQRIGRIRYRAPLRSLGGSLSLAPPPARGLTQLVLGPELDYTLQVSELGTSGSLAIIVHEFTDGRDTTSIPVDGLPLVRFAAWPVASDCRSNEVVAPLDRNIDGVSPGLVSELVAGQRVPFTWADGTETTLALSPRPSAGFSCALEDRGQVHWSFDTEASAATADGILNGPIAGSARLVQNSERVIAIFDMRRSSSRDELIALLPTSTVAPNFDGGYVDFSVSYTFAWPSWQPLGSEGRLSIAVAPPPACDAEECDVRFTLAEGGIPATAAPRE